jgi:hypothetical protein
VKKNTYHNSKRLLKIAILLMLPALMVFNSSCSRRVYYSSERVYNARKEQDKRIRKKGYTNQQHRMSQKQLEKMRKKKRNFSKKKTSFGGGKGKK